MPLRPPAGFISAFYDPLKVPNAPTIGTATGGNTQASVTFTAPTNVGGSAISAYYAVSNPGQITGTAASSPITVTGLTNGTAYTFTVWALNTYGPSPYSAASGSVTPNLVTYLATLYTGSGYSAAADTSGNIYSYGNQQSPSNSTFAKYNSAGVLQWKKQLSLTSGTGPQRIATDSSGNVISAMPTGSQIKVVEVAANGGSIVWQKYVTGWPSGCSGVSTQVAGVATDSSDNVYVASPVYQACEYTLSVFKLNSSGTLQWARKLSNGLRSDEVVGAASDSSGNVYAVCGINASYYNGYLVKYNTSGTLQWQRTVATGSGSSYLRDVAVDSSGNVYVTGITSYGGATIRMFVAKYDSSGTNLWARELYSGSAPVYGYGLGLDSSGNVYVCGYYLYDYIMCMAKWNSSGVIQWQRQLSGYSSRKSYGYDVAVDSDGVPAFIGYSTNSSNSDQKYLMAKVPADGSKTGTYTLNGNSFVYSATSFTEAAFAGTLGTGGATSSTIGLSASNDALTLSDSSMTSDVTII